MSLVVNKQDGFFGQRLWARCLNGTSSWHRSTWCRRTEGWTAAGLLGHDTGQQLRQAAMIKAIPFDFPYDGRLVPANTALLVIDLQEDFLSPTGYFARKGYAPAPLRPILPTVNRRISAARAADLTIIYTRQGYRGDMADMTPYER